MGKRSLFVLLAVTTFLLVSDAAGFSTGAQEGDQVSLNWPCIWVGKDSKAPAVAALVEQFNKKYSGKITVAIEPNPDYDGYRDKINASIAAGQVPDLFVFNPDPTTFQYYQGELLMDFAKDLSGDWGKRFVAGTIKGATIDGKVKSLPYEIGVAPIWYNKALFAKAGVTQFPKTFAEFWQVCDKLKAAGIVPTAQMTGGSNAWTSMLWFSHLIASIGGADAWDQPLFVGPMYVKAAEIIQRMYQDGNTTKDAVGADAGVAGGHFLAGQTAMFLNGPWYIGRVKNEAPDVYKNSALAPAPAVEGGTYGGEIVFALSNLAAGNAKNASKRAAVIEFLKWMTLPDNIRQISETSGSLFAVAYQADPAKIDPVQAQFIKEMNTAPFTISHLQMQMPTKVVAQFGQGLGGLALGQMTPQQFVDFMHQQLEQAK